MQSLGLRCYRVWCRRLRAAGRTLTTRRPSGDGSYYAYALLKHLLKPEKKVSIYVFPGPGDRNETGNASGMERSGP